MSDDSATPKGERKRGYPLRGTYLSIEILPSPNVRDGVYAKGRIRYWSGKLKRDHESAFTAFGPEAIQTLRSKRSGDAADLFGSFGPLAFAVFSVDTSDRATTRKTRAA